MLKTVSSVTNAIGALNYKGTWNANTNTPTLADGTGAKGDYYVVSTSGTQTFDGIQYLFGVGDWIVYNGAVWQRVEGGNTGEFVTVSAEAYRLLAGGVVTDATTARTLSAGDNGKVLYFTSGSAIQVDTASGLGAGFSCMIIQGDAGQITVAEGVGTTRDSFGSFFKTTGQYAVVSVVSPVADTFILGGNLTA